LSSSVSDATKEVGSNELIAGRFESAFTFPGRLEPSSILQPFAAFNSMSSVPLAAGGSIDLSRLPLSADTENLVQLCNVDGSFTLRNHQQKYQVKVRTNPLSLLVENICLFHSRLPSSQTFAAGVEQGAFSARSSVAVQQGSSEFPLGSFSLSIYNYILHTAP
jgi:hypothetical protein